MIVIKTDRPDGNPRCRQLPFNIHPYEQGNGGRGKAKSADEGLGVNDYYL